MHRKAALVVLCWMLLSCAAAPVRPRAVAPTISDTILLDDVEKRSFHYFWDLADPNTQLIPDRWPTPSFSSIAAVGFGLTAYGIGAERGYVTREAAAQRTEATLQSLLAMKQGPAAQGISGYHGFYYHFLDMKTAERFQPNDGGHIELSTIDTTLLVAGALFAQSYFDRDNPTESEIRRDAETLYERVEWTWEEVRPPLVSMGWSAEDGFHGWDWHGYNEAMILLILAMGSPSHPIDPSSWTAYHATDKWGTVQGQTFVQFAPLFGHQYSEVWIDFRGIRDPVIAAHDIDWFENSRRATLAQHAYAVANPNAWREYGDTIWGLSACDGPMDATAKSADGRLRTYHSYTARGVAENDIRDDGTIAPTAAASSIVFTPALSIAAMRDMSTRYSTNLYAQYGFLDAFNPTLRTTEHLKHGHVVPDQGWFDVDYLGIDEGPIVAMIENYRSELVWKTMRKNPHVIRGLKRAGFTGGWIDEQH